MELQRFKNKLFLFVLLMVFSSCNSFYFNNDLQNILGLADIEITDKYTNEDLAGLSGEGIIFERYKLSDKTIQKFQDKIIKNNRSYFKDNVFVWDKTPIDSASKEPLSMIVDYSTNNTEMQKAVKEIKNIICKPNIYHAFIYEENNDHVVCFFIDIDSKTLYAIDQRI